MKRRIALAASTLGSVALLAVAAAPASAASPPGQGLFDYGTFTCEGIGDISILAPRAAEAAAGFTSAGETVITVSLSGTATVDGETFSFSKSYGVKAGLESFTCTQHFEEDGFVSDLTVVVAVVPPQ
jgi:hypothetical protein